VQINGAGQGWVTVLKEIEPNLQIEHGYCHLEELREASNNLRFKLNIIKVALP
jgi:hypothetical protein